MTRQAELENRTLELLNLKRFPEASQLLSDALAELGESAWLWNDWAMVRFAAGDPLDAERALRRALGLEPGFAPAAENLGVILFAQHKSSEALPLLELALTAASGPQRDALQQLIATCRTPLPSPESLPEPPRV